MSNQAPSIEATWAGPFSWPKFEEKNDLPPIPKSPGVYLQTFEYDDGYLIYAAGLTQRSVLKRFREHTRHFMNGGYTVLDMQAIKKGIRKEIWHGWGYAREHPEEFEENKSRILEAVQEQLSAYRIFVADVGTRKRILERLEAAVMDKLYQSPSPFCDIPDEGMQLSPRWDTEKPILVQNRCEANIHRLPPVLQI